MFEIDFLQSSDRESVMSLDLPILIMPLIIPSTVPTFPFLSSREVRDQIEER